MREKRNSTLNESESFTVTLFYDFLPAYSLKEFIKDLDYVYNQLHLEKSGLKSAKQIPNVERLEIKTIESKHSITAFISGALDRVLLIIFKIAQEYLKTEQLYLENKKLRIEIQQAEIDLENASRLGEIIRNRIRILHRQKIGISVKRGNEIIDFSESLESEYIEEDENVER